MFYIKLLALGLWVVFCSIIVIIKAIPRWGEPSLGSEFGKLYAWGALKIAGIKVETQGLENLDNQPCIYTLNHQSNFDMAIFGAQYPKNTVIIGKKEIKWLPVFGLLYVATGNIMIDRKKSNQAKESLNQVTQEIKTRKVSIWIFPEGTRNKAGVGLLPFKKGPFHMAVSAQVPVVPLVSASQKKVVDWEKKKFIGGTIQVRILPPISTIGLTENDVSELAEKTRTIMLEEVNKLNEA